MTSKKLKAAEPTKRLPRTPKLKGEMKARSGKKTTTVALQQEVSDTKRQETSVATQLEDAVATQLKNAVAPQLKNAVAPQLEKEGATAKRDVAAVSDRMTFSPKAKFAPTKTVYKLASGSRRFKLASRSSKTGTIMHVIPNRSAESVHVLSVNENIHYRRCHICNQVTESDKGRVHACAQCGKVMAPFFFFEECETPILSEFELRPFVSPGQHPPVRGLTAFW